MKAEKISIKWKLILYMTLFVAVEFILMSAFHMFFLDNFYRNIKVNELKSAAKSITTSWTAKIWMHCLKTLRGKAECA